MLNTGYLISFEGIGGAGKTSVIQFMQKYLKTNNTKSIIKNDMLRYKNNALGGDIRQILINNSNKDLFFRTGHPFVEALLILAKRTYESTEILVPKIRAGGIVLADRDVDTVCAYQLVSLLKVNPSLNVREFISLVREINRFSSVEPSLTYFLDVSIANAIQRIERRDNKKLTSSAIEFLEEAQVLYEKVLGYKMQARELVKIDTNNISLDEVCNNIKKHHQKWHQKRF